MLPRRRVPDGQAAPSSENDGISAVSSHSAPRSMARGISPPPLKRPSGNSYTPAPFERFQAPQVTDRVPRNEDVHHDKNAKVHTAGAGKSQHRGIVSSFPPKNLDYGLSTLRSSQASSPQAFTSRLPRSPPFTPPLSISCDGDGSEHSMSSNQPNQEPANHIPRKSILYMPDGAVTRSYMTETASSTSTTSRTQNMCRGCRKSGNQLLPLIPCSKCRRGFHKGCGNPKPSQSTNLENFVCGKCVKEDQKAVASDNSKVQIPTPRASTEAVQATTSANAATSSNHTAVSGVNKVQPGNAIPTGPRGQMKDTPKGPNGSKAVIPAMQSDRYKHITCPWWQANDCVFAENHCEFAHTDTGKYAPSLTSLRPTRAKDFTCRLWLDGKCVMRGKDCYYAHTDTGLYFSCDERATRKHITCYYWHTGYCELAEEACPFAHKETRIVQWQPAEDAQSRPGPYSLQSYTCPRREKGQPCRFRKDGNCPYSHAPSGMSSLGVETLSHPNQSLPSASSSHSPSPSQALLPLWARSARQSPVNVRAASLSNGSAPRHPEKALENFGQEISSGSSRKSIRSSVQTVDLYTNVQAPVKALKRHMARRSSPLDPRRRNIAVFVPKPPSITPAVQQAMASDTEKADVRNSCDVCQKKIFLASRCVRCKASALEAGYCRPAVGDGVTLPPTTALPLLNENHSPEMVEGFVPLNGAQPPNETLLQQALVANKLKRRASGGSSIVSKRPRLSPTPLEHPQARGAVTELRRPDHESTVLAERPSSTDAAEQAISDWRPSFMTRTDRLDAMAEELLPDMHTPQVATPDRLSDYQNSKSAGPHIAFTSTFTPVTKDDNNPTTDRNELPASENGDRGSISQPEARQPSLDSSRQLRHGQPGMTVNGETTVQTPAIASLDADLVLPNGLFKRCFRCTEQGHHRRCLHGMDGLLNPTKCLIFIRKHRLRYPGQTIITRQEWDSLVASAKASFPDDSEIQALDGPEDEAVDIDDSPGPIEDDDLRASAPSSAQTSIRAENAAPAIPVNETALGALPSLGLSHSLQAIRTAVQRRDWSSADQETAIQKLQARGVQFESDTDEDEEGETVDQPPPRRIEALWQPGSSKHLFEIDRHWDSQFEPRAYASSISRPPKKKIIGNLLKYQCSDRRHKFGNPHQEVRRSVRQVEVRALVQIDQNTDPKEMPQLVEKEKAMTFGEFLGMPEAPVIAPSKHKDELEYTDKHKFDRSIHHGGGIATHRARRVREENRYPFVYTSR